MTLYERILRLERQTKNLNKAVCCIQNGDDPDVPAARFGFAGEDEVAGENRTFTHLGYDFQVGDPLNSSTYLGIYLNNAYEIYANIQNPDFPGAGYGYLDFNASIGDGSVYLDFYVEGSDSSNDYTELTLEPGQLSIYLGATAVVMIDGVQQDDGATMIAALDGSNNLVWVDKSTIGGTTPVLRANLTSTFGSSDGMSGGGAIFYDITGLNLSLDPISRYEFEAVLYMNENGSGGVEQFQVTFDQVPQEINITYERIASGPTGTSDWVQARGEHIFGNDYASPADYDPVDFLPITQYRMRITGTIVTAPFTPTVIQAKAGIFGSIGAFSVYRESYIKATKIE